jgi:hypothetical protein
MTAGYKYLSTWDKPFAFPGQFGLRKRLEVQWRLIGDLGDKISMVKKDKTPWAWRGVDRVKDSRQGLPGLCAETRI